MSRNLELRTASDYATLVVGRTNFYYGYEFGLADDPDEDMVQVWGFQMVRRGAREGDPIFVFRISAEDMRTECDLADDLTAAEMLLVGIGLYMEHQEPQP